MFHYDCRPYQLDLSPNNLKMPQSCVSRDAVHADEYYTDPLVCRPMVCKLSYKPVDALAIPTPRASCNGQFAVRRARVHRRLPTNDPVHRQPISFDPKPTEQIIESPSAPSWSFCAGSYFLPRAEISPSAPCLRTAFPS